MVYTIGTPSLYINGAFVKTGLRTGYTVHPIAAFGPQCPALCAARIHPPSDTRLVALFRASGRLAGWQERT